MSGRIEYRLLGPLDVRIDVPVAVGGPKQRALLALLLLSANRVVSRDRLIEEVFAGERGASARRLNVHISRLRRVVGARLLTRVPGYLLQVGPGELDLHVFEQSLADGRRALEREDVESAAALLGEALALWRGRPLADLEFEPFARLEAERLDELRLSAVEDRIEVELALGRHGALVPELETLVAEHALHERLRGQLMLALYRSGRQAEALAVYRAGRALLVDELALEPSPRLKELEQAILRQDDALDGGVRRQADTGRQSVAAIELEPGPERELAQTAEAKTSRTAEAREQRGAPVLRRIIAAGALAFALAGTAAVYWATRGVARAPLAVGPSLLDIGPGGASQAGRRPGRRRRGLRVTLGGRQRRWRRDARRPADGGRDSDDQGRRGS
jgi:DNA-binding SARP family transcriptional activator